MNISDVYDLLKALHVAAALLFIGGVVATTMFLAVHDRLADVNGAATVWRRWDGGLTTPAMLSVWVLGLTLAYSGGWFRVGWLPVKLVFVLLLSGLHGIQSGMLRRIAGGQAMEAKSTMMLGAVLTSVLLIAVLAVTKPF